MKHIIQCLIVVGCGFVLSFPVLAKDKIDFWLKTEFTQSTLSYEDQYSEMEWFAKKSEPYQGLTIRVTSEIINTHLYEANVLAKAFHDITGIRVIHEVSSEDDIVKKFSYQLTSDDSIYDAHIVDTDLIGLLARSGKVIPIKEIMSYDDGDLTLPTLGIDDFLGLQFATSDGVLYQLPDQHFVNLYWYRHDWFTRPALKSKFRQLYGYELGIPVNWVAYEDIAEFFTVHVKEIDGRRIYGHMDYGRNDPSLGWRFSDAWFAMAGMGDVGIPNGKPVDEWGIRVKGCNPVGASVERGGAINGPAAIYALTKFKQWLFNFAPTGAPKLTFSQSGGVSAEGSIAQQIFWYSAFASTYAAVNTPIVSLDGQLRWRVAPTPTGKYWRKGMKVGYQDVGAWTFLRSTPMHLRQAAWLYAQFTVSKTVSLKKTMVTNTPIRRSDVFSELLDNSLMDKSGILAFYQSKNMAEWSPTGDNVPDYPSLSAGWYLELAGYLEGKLTAQRALDNLARFFDRHLLKLQQEALANNVTCAPILNPKQDKNYWLKRSGSPKAEITTEPKGKTVPVDSQLW